MCIHVLHFSYQLLCSSECLVLPELLHMNMVTSKLGRFYVGVYRFLLLV